jgi:hypothetical protein
MKNAPMKQRNRIAPNLIVALGCNLKDSERHATAKMHTPKKTVTAPAFSRILRTADDNPEYGSSAMSANLKDNATSAMPSGSINQARRVESFIGKRTPQGLKPFVCYRFAARLKPCPPNRDRYYCLSTQEEMTRRWISLVPS